MFTRGITVIILTHYSHTNTSQPRNNPSGFLLALCTEAVPFHCDNILTASTAVLSEHRWNPMSLHVDRSQRIHNFQLSIKSVKQFNNDLVGRGAPYLGHICHEVRSNQKSGIGRLIGLPELQHTDAIVMSPPTSPSILKDRSCLRHGKTWNAD